MKIILFPSTSDPVGVGTSVYNLSKLFDSYGYLHDVLCPTKGWLTEQLYKKNIPHSVLFLSFLPSQFIKSIFRVFRYLRRQPSSVVHLNGRFPLFITCLSILLVRKHRYVITVRQFSCTGNHGVWAWKQHLESFLLRIAVFKIVCVSKGLETDILRRVGLKYKPKILCIPNMISPLHCDYPLRPINFKSKCVRIVSAGRLSNEKGFDVLIRSVTKLLADGYDVKCDIYGDGPDYCRLNEMIKCLGLYGIVSLKGVSSKLRNLLPNYDLAVIPSREESFGLVALECFDAGVPVVASNIPGLSEIVLTGETGLLFTVNDPIDLSDKIKTLIDDSSYAHLIRLEGRKLLQRYIPNRDFLNLYLSAFEVN